MVSYLYPLFPDHSCRAIPATQPFSMPPGYDASYSPRARLGSRMHAPHHRARPQALAHTGFQGQRCSLGNPSPSLSGWTDETGTSEVRYNGNSSTKPSPICDWGPLYGRYLAVVDKTHHGLTRNRPMIPRVYEGSGQKSPKETDLLFSARNAFLL